jgi:hypothetical protein
MAPVKDRVPSNTSDYMVIDLSKGKEEKFVTHKARILSIKGDMATV